MKDTDYTKVEAWTSLLTESGGREAIRAAVADERWQALRLAMINSSLQSRHEVLSKYVGNQWITEEERRLRRIRVSNYINALKRGGMIK